MLGLVFLSFILKDFDLSMLVKMMRKNINGRSII